MSNTETTTRIDNKELNERARERGLEIAIRFPVKHDREFWVVPDPPSRSFTCRVVLTDDPKECLCTCAAFAETQPCCHIHAARFAQMREGGQPLPVPSYPGDVPPGAPKWVTPELIRETYRVWHLYYPERLTPQQVLAMILDVGRLSEG